MDIDAGGQPWRRIGWDGIAFNVPDHWQIARIGRRHLFFTDDNGPVLEIKWSAAGTDQKAERIIAQLTGRHRGKLTAAPLPAEWQKALAGRPAAGFAWSAGTTRGQGVACRLVQGTWALVQFLGPIDGQTSSALLAAMADGTDGNKRFWAVYDVKALLDPVFEVIRWDFSAGTFRIDFKAKGRQLALYRFAPANVILKTKDLNTLAAKLLPAAIAVNVAPQAGEWLWQDGAAVNRLRRALGMAPLAQRLRLWHLADANRILGVWLKGPGVSKTEMDSICQAYVPYPKPVASVDRNPDVP